MRNDAIRDYDELIDALRERASVLGLSHREIEKQTGLARGYVSKLLSPAHPKTLGPKSMTLLLRELGLSLAIVAVDPKRRDTRQQSPEPMRQ